MKDLIIRARKDPNHRSGLSVKQQPSPPEGPAGEPLTEMAETQLDHAVGGHSFRSAERIAIGMDLVK